MKKMVIGIASQQAIRARALAIARGDHQPRPNEPKIWLTSMRSLAEVLSDDNRALLRVIREQKPESLSQLAEFTGARPAIYRVRSRPWNAMGWSRCAARCVTCSLSPRLANS